MKSKKISLVLSSGGARGIAHLGVIDVLEENGFQISSIVGCSMGALVGGMYAAGNYQALKEWLFALNKKKIVSLIDADVNTSYVVRGDVLIKNMMKTMPDCLIENCKIPFSAVASNVKDEKEVVFVKGSLYEAIRASISIPIFFKPIQTQHQLLMDGAVLNPFPLNYAQKNDGELLVAVNVTAFSNAQFPPHLSRSKNEEIHPKRQWHFPKNTFFIKGAFLHQEAETVIQLLLASNSKLMSRLYPCDLQLDLPASSFHCFDFLKAREIYETGRNLMQMRIADLEKLV